jgi:hypothetical protein
MSWESAVVIVTAEGSEFESRYGQYSSPLHVVHTGSAAHPASYPMDKGGSFPKGKAAGADHSPSTSANVKNTLIYTSTPPYAFITWCLIS